MPRHTKALIDIIQKEQIKIFAEVGVFKGRNMRNILRSESSKMLEEYWAIDPWVNIQKSSKLTANNWHVLYRRICKHSCYFKQLRVLRLASVEATLVFPNEYFDMVYIDADHSYSEIRRDIAAWLPKVKIGKLLGGHDYNLRAVHKAVNELLTGVWEPPPQPGRRKQDILRTKIWLKRKLE